MVYCIFLFVCSLLVPLTMVAVGIVFLRRPPKKANHTFGYRTALSMKNQQTWDAAHKLCGGRWLQMGLPLLGVTLIIMLCLFDEGPESMANALMILVAVQLCLMMTTIPAVEKQLHRLFDENGSPRR